MHSNPWTSRIYKGVFPSDRIPVMKKFPWAAVINHDPEGFPGTHWVVLVASDNFHVHYFDSTGVDGVPNVIEYMRKNFPMSTRQHSSLQNRDTKVCGHYAIFFTYMLSKGSSFERVEKWLKYVKFPDIFVYDFVDNVIKKQIRR